MTGNCNRWRVVILGALCLALSALSRAATPAACTKIVLSGEVAANHEWKQPFGQGWVFRLVPIGPGSAGYSGWDLVVDREQPAGFPDALLLATPPYNSISEREVGTTFGLRVQDAIGWNPRGFRFLTDPVLFKASREHFLQMIHNAQSAGAVSQKSVRGGQAGQIANEQLVAPWMLDIMSHSSAGEFRIIDTRFAPGTADAAPYAEKWAIQSARTPHTLAPPAGAKATPLGELDWMHFSITLWLPRIWNAPKDLHAVRVPCSE